MEGMAPKIFARKNRWDVPYYAIIISALPAALAYLVAKFTSNNVHPMDINLIADI
jgi:amino acid permease